MRERGESATRTIQLGSAKSLSTRDLPRKPRPPRTTQVLRFSSVNLSSIFDNFLVIKGRERVGEREIEMVYRRGSYNLQCNAFYMVRSALVFLSIFFSLFSRLVFGAEMIFFIINKTYPSLSFYLFITLLLIKLIE